MAPARRRIIGVLATCIVLLAATLAFQQWSAARHFDERHSRWLSERMPVYDEMAAKVIAQKATLTSQPRELADIVPTPFTASARTNSDGSVTIMFPGGEGGPRHGYIYHSGALLTQHPGDPDAYLCHLTNGWYEY